MWRIKGTIRFGVLGQINTDNSDMLPEFIELLDSKFETSQQNKGPWRTYLIELKNCSVTYRLSIYRKRFFLYRIGTVLKNDSIDNIVRYAMNEEDLMQKEALNLFYEALLADISYTTYRIVFIEKIDLSRSGIYDIIDEGLTTFNFRINDSNGKMGLIRVSRHILLCAGLKGYLLQEIINMCYEKMLTNSSRVSADNVFAFLDGLNRFTIPSEENRFLQKSVLKITLLLTIVPIVYDIIVNQLSFNLAFKLTIGGIVLSLLIVLIIKPLSWE